jgi:hypothetical protein
MARNKNKSLLLKAKRARQERIDTSLADLSNKINQLSDAGLHLNDDDTYTPEYAKLIEQLNAVHEERDEFEDNQRERNIQKMRAKDELRQAKLDNGLRVGKLKNNIQWAEGGQALVPGRKANDSKFFGAQEAGLAKVSRDIGRWETLDPYANARGVNKGEIVMIISEKYQVDVARTRRRVESKWAVDVMVGPHVVKGIPAAALRPLEED